ncbi:Uncharacterised protein [Bartonella vinsonii]|uniref:Uncharacterized protein n=1 Tax=Bartonella vinsonii TaxID=33047 RepID=A0A3S5C6I9_BARVI|nr:Uncharacterised protein [Bartonella vinsonii]
MPLQHVASSFPFASLITSHNSLNSAKFCYEELLNNLTNISIIPQPNESKDLCCNDFTISICFFSQEYCYLLR